MSAALGGAVELLDRALAYTRVALAEVGPGDLTRPTPCHGWDLARLLAHLEDALDAFTEAASGHVHVAAPGPTANRVEVLREKACALLGAWTAALGEPVGTPAGQVSVGDVDLAAPVLVATAALEVTVHGWDVAQATGARSRIPEDLARGLLEVARFVVDPLDRGAAAGRFARARPVAADAPYDTRLLLFLGRDLTGPPLANRSEGDPRPGVAS